MEPNFLIFALLKIRSHYDKNYQIQYLSEFIEYSKSFIYGSPYSHYNFIALIEAAQNKHIPYIESFNVIDSNNGFILFCRLDAGIFIYGQN